jgi:poly(glycerol-phosphate) alpha-glucosyltransferase
MPRAARTLPTTRHFAVTWGLPDDFGGMTSVILRRSAGFAAAGAPVTVLCFDDRLDTAAAAARLRDEGVIADGVDVLHLWDWLAAHPLSPKEGVETLPFAPLAPGSGIAVEFAGVVRRRERRDPGGALLQVDRYRPDGSLLASDLRDAEGGRSVVVCDAAGVPARGWRSIWALYRHWLDLVTAKKRSMIVVDSKTAARFMRGYRRKHAAVVHVVHSSHRAGDGEPGQPFKASRREALDNAADFDAVVVLTERQRRDLAADLAAPARLAVVPNAATADRLRDAPLGREPGRGVVVASLTSRKRLEHAIAAAASAGVPLDVFGEGPERGVLQAQIAGLGADARLLGHSTGAPLAFREASFSLLTSTSEGAPLVLLESMAAGCIPIAYDIRYGPGDIIRDGVDGFVVEPGDVEAMAARIRQIVTMPERRLRRMRRAGRRSAARYTQTGVTELWADLFAQIAAERWLAPAKRPLRVRVAGRLRAAAARLR